jgi:eukaryotic translation initiation factor 2C
MSSRALHTLSVCTPARYADFLCDRLRMYMRPALAKNAVPPNASSDNAILAAYSQDLTIWGQGRNKQSGMNPWSEKVNDIMFYL